jgi:hypothetical protein
VVDGNGMSNSGHFLKGKPNMCVESLTCDGAGGALDDENEIDDDEILLVS